MKSKRITLKVANPELANQWDPTKNGALSPEQVSPGSNKMVWWKCPKGDDHEWEATIKSRNHGSGCAICSGYKVVNSNCLLTINPELANQWHPTKNGVLTSSEVSSNSSKKVWWKCPEGDDHEWEAVVYSRTAGKGCPICAGKKIVFSNNVKTLYPQLANE